MTTLQDTPLLDQIRTPDDLRLFKSEDLPPLAKELRQEVINVVSKTGGHLGASLGVIELTIALHYTFNTPHDRLIWDVGHQSYPHKILTNRRHLIHTLRQADGLSGFTKRAESEYDTFGAAHSSTSISAGIGIGTAFKLLQNKQNFVISVIGDGAMSAGMAYEAMNNTGHLNSKLIIILNDNEMSIAPPVGAMSTYLSKLISAPSYQALRSFSKDITKNLPSYMSETICKAEHYARGMLTGGTLFEELGFHYVGPIDGHNLENMLIILNNLKNVNGDRPILLHAITQKGKGYRPAELSSDKYHGVSKFNVDTGVQVKGITPTPPTYTNVFADTLIEEAHKDPSIVAITAAMPSGTGLNKFMKVFPHRTFDVGIAEQHAVTFAGGLATENIKPVVAIYSTFLQRAYDQVVHDIAIQSLPVRFAIDRAGLVGADGPTHAGAFDISYLGCLPNFVIMVAADELELKHMIATSLSIQDRPSAFRFPRGNGTGVSLSEPSRILEIGKGRIIKQGSDIALLSLGTRLEQSLKAAQVLDEKGLSTTVADARFAKPVDKDLIRQLAAEHKVLITIEENAIGGFAAHVLETLTSEYLLDSSLLFRSLMLPDTFIDHNSLDAMYEEAELNSPSIVQTALDAIKAFENKNK